MYAAVLTAAWLGVLALQGYRELSLAALIPAVAVAGAWLAARGSRAGYLGFAMMSAILLLGLLIGTAFTLLMSAVTLMGGTADDMLSLLATAAVMAGLAALHVMGLFMLKGHPR